MTDVDTLVRHVYESNAIEQINVSSGDPLFKRHLLAAKAVESKARQSILMTPLEIHSILLPELAGYRTCDVYVGPRIMPPHAAIPELMEEWLRAYDRWFNMIPSNPPIYWKRWIEGEALHRNDWLLCIHPFEGGNGRTARLIMNSFRRCAKQSWYIIYVGDRTSYYHHIRHFEDKVFATWHPPHVWKY